METCYRHPDRETAVSCSNCGRPICPDCMTSTPVGMRCPECSRQRTRVTTGTSTFGRSNAAPATWVLIALNVIAFIAELAGGADFTGEGSSVVNDFATFAPAIADGEWYRILTGGFLHAGPIHLGFNMFALYILGTLLEPTIGSTRFVAIYLASLLAGSLGVVVLEPDTQAVGASGAVFGLFAAAFVIARGRGLQEVASQLGFLILINFAFTFSIPGISIGAHLFGAAGGALCALLVVAGDRGAFGSRRVAAELVAIVALGLVASALAVGVA
jgi:membrane associated rhomboid family serine protease